MTDPATDAFSITRVSDYVISALAEVVEAAARLNVILPSRQITGVGVIPADCEQVVASLIQLTTGAPEAAGGRGGAGTYPNAASNMTIYTVIVSLEITRKTTELSQGRLGNTAPDPATFTANLTSVSADTAVLIAAVNALAEDQIVSANTRTVTAGAPQGGMFKVSARLTAVV